MRHLTVRTLLLTTLLIPSAAGAFVSVLDHDRIGSNDGGLGFLPFSTYFGRSSAWVPDLDGDGNDDLVVGRSTGFHYAGGVSVLFLDAQRQVIGETLLEAGMNGVPANALDGFGASVAALGDLDGDGVEDIAVGSPNEIVNPTGTVWIFFLNADGTVKSFVEIQGSAVPGLQAGDRLGASLSFLGDRDSDGDPELAVGAIGDYSAGSGAVWILELASDGSVTGSRRIAAGQAGLTGHDQHGGFGYAVTRIADLDGNGREDLAVGSYRDFTVPNQFGTVSILFLDSTDSVVGTARIDHDTIGLDVNEGYSLGFSLAWLDALGCGQSALVVGSPLSNIYFGEVWILELDATGAVIAQQEIGDDAGTLPAPLDYEGHFGWLSAPGDLDGNGTDDLVVGASEADNDRGAVWLLQLTRQKSDPRFVEFGYVFTGDVLDTTVTLTNEGCTTVAGTLSTDSADFEILGGGGAFSLAPGESLPVGVRFAPVGGNLRTGSLLTDSAFGAVALSGTGRIAVNPCLGHWNLDTFNAANLGPGPDNHALWCGVQAGEPGFATPPGHGSHWSEPLVWASQVEPFVESNELRIRFDYNLDIISGTFSVERVVYGSWVELFSASGSTADTTGAFTTPSTFDETFTIDAVDRVWVDGQPGIAVRLLVDTGAYSDENGFDSDGAVQIDNLQIWLDGELVSDADFEPDGSDGGWCTEPNLEIPDAADFWHAGFEAPPAGNGLDGQIRSMVVHDGDLIVGGQFSQAGTAAANRIARFDGTTWHALGDGFADGYVWSLASYDGKLYAAGDFTVAGGSPADHLAVWNGSSWQPTAITPGWTVGAMGVWQDELYVPDDTAYPQPITGGLKIYNGTGWRSMDAPFSIGSFTGYQGSLHVTTYNGKLYRLDGTTFTELGQVNNDIYAAVVYDDLLVIGGIWNIPPPGGSYGITAWDGTGWVPMPEPPDLNVESMTLYNGRLVVAGGMFPAVTSWENGVERPMGAAVYSGDVFAVASWRGSLWAGGVFTSMSGKPSAYIAQWTDPGPVAAPDAPPAAAARVTLSAGRPNPFNPRVSFSYSIPSGGEVRAAVYDLRGRRVATLVDGVRSAGTHPLVWNGRDHGGRTVASGTYLVRVEHDAGTATRRVVLLK